MNKKIVCFGAAHIDYKAIAMEKVVMGSSNPVRTKMELGGVCRNIAETLARLDLDITIVSRVGNDFGGENIIQSLKMLNVNTTYISRSNQSPTASFTGFLDASGEMVVGLADMGIYEELTPDTICKNIDNLKDASLWVADLNLPLETVNYLAHQKPKHCKLIIIPVSVAKLNRLDEKIFSEVDLLLLNTLELAALTKIKIQSQDSILEASQLLIFKGVKKVIVTEGPKDIVITTNEGSQVFPTTPTTNIVDTLGGGDGLAAGYIYGTVIGENPSVAIKYGIEVSKLAIATQGCVNPRLTIKKLKLLVK